MKIKIKILILMIVSVLSVLLISTYYTQKIIANDAETTLQDEIIKIVKQIDSSVVTARELTNIAAIDENFQELMFIRSNIARIDLFVLQNNGALKLLISKTTVPLKQTRIAAGDVDQIKMGRILSKTELIDGVNYVNVIAPVHLNERVFGLTEVKISRKDFDSIIAKHRKQAFIIAIISVLFIMAMMLLSLNHLIHRPIQRLLWAMGRVKDGDLSVSVTPRTKDEIGTLTDSFNEMVRKIKESTEVNSSLLNQVNSFNEELQKKIETATKEIQHRNEELVDANQAIYKMQKELGHSNRLAAFGQLAANVAHELGTPLHSVSGHLQLLMEETNLSETMRRRMVIMQSQVDRLVKSIQNLLDTTRPPDTSFERVDMNILLEELIILILPETVSKQIIVDKEFQHDLPKIYGSPRKLQEIFLNLLDNAIDASPQGSVITVKTKAVASEDGSQGPESTPSQTGWLHVIIKDTGRGIPQDSLQHIFEPFYTTKDRGQGTGLGLAICQDIIHSYHGIVMVESKVDEGSTFTVKIPLMGIGE